MSGHNPEQTHPSTDVYAVHGAEPEVLAYAMAKYSRSSLTLRESLREISTQRAEQFLNTFYFQYGHRSIADLAHIPFAIERLSLLAATVLVDEQRWDGQERSTRYQDFRKSGWYTPHGLGAAGSTYDHAVRTLFSAYEQVGEGMFTTLQRQVPRPAEMKQEQYDRTLRARAFDMARALLPLATNTSLGQIVNARTLEGQISRLLTSEFREVRDLGHLLRKAAAEPAWNPQAPNAPDGVRTAPTLVKYALHNEFQASFRTEMRAAIADLMAGAPVSKAPAVDLLEDDALELELAASLLYPHGHYPYRQIRDCLAGLPAGQLTELVTLAVQARGRHDELPRSFHTGGGLRFDILMDIGGFRDMHRHRRCTQLIQPFTDLHGFAEPDAPGQPTLAEAGLESIYRGAIATAFQAGEDLRVAGSEEAAESAQYLLPLATRCRSLFTMDLAEAVYITELRSTPAGHWSYRRIAWQMAEAVRHRHPTLAPLFRVQDVHAPVDLLQR